MSASPQRADIPNPTFRESGTASDKTIRVGKVVEATNIAPVVVAVRYLAEFERLSGGSLRLSSQQNARGQSSPELNSQNVGFGMSAIDGKADLPRTSANARV
jgi:hypothetical protein